MNTSPFELFRRNLKPFMVFATFLALISFVVLPILQTYMQQRAGTGGDGVIAKYSGMDVSRSRVEYFTRNHQSTVRFLNDLANDTIARGGVPKTAGFQYDAQNKQIRSLGINQNPSMDGTIRTFMFANEAREAGFDLDDVALQTWLDRFTDGVFSDTEINAKLMQATGNQMGPAHLYEQLRNHLLADVYLRRGSVGLYGDQGPLLTPDEQWTNFLKLNRNATVSAYGILVNDYLSQTDETPSDSRIREVFEEGKDRDPSDQSSEPAFHRQYTAKFEYLVGNYQTFLDEEKGKLSEDAIRAEYDRRLKGGDFQMPADEPADETEPADEIEPSDKTEPVDETERSGGPESAGESEPADEKMEQASEESKPSSESDQEATDSPAEDESKADDSGAEESTSESEEQPDPADQSYNTEPAVRFVIQQDEEAGVGTEDAADTKKKADVASDKPADEKPEKKKPKNPKNKESAAKKEGDKKESDAKMTEAKPEKKAPEKKAPEKKKTEEQPKDEPQAKKTEEKPAEPKVKGFDEVREQIAEDLAGPTARKRLDSAVTEVTSAMRTYFSRMAVHQGQLTNGQKSDPPPRPDLGQMATKLGMKHETIGPHSEASIGEEPIADSFEVGTQFGRRGPSFAVMMYGFNNGQTELPKQPLFAPVRTADDQAGKIYVTWKSEVTEAYTPTLDEAREQVILAIRTEEARNLAIEAAEAFAKKASDGAEFASLIPEDRKEYFKEGLGPFSWMDSFGFSGATIGNVPDLDSVGDEFMKAVFSTKVDQYGVASNQPKRVVYVVKPTQFEPPIEELRRQFKQPVNRMMARMVASDAGKVVRGYYDQIDKKTGFESFLEEEQ